MWNLKYACVHMRQPKSVAYQKRLHHALRYHYLDKPPKTLLTLSITPHPTQAHTPTPTQAKNPPPTLQPTHSNGSATDAYYRIQHTPLPRTKPSGRPACVEQGKKGVDVSTSPNVVADYSVDETRSSQSERGSAVQRPSVPGRRVVP
jgi:hypothetical protein